MSHRFHFHPSVACDSLFRASYRLFDGGFLRIMLARRGNVLTREPKAPANPGPLVPYAADGGKGSRRFGILFLCIYVYMRMLRRAIHSYMYIYM